MILNSIISMTRNEKPILYSFNLLAYLSLFEADCNLFLFELKIIYYLTF